MQNSSKRSKRSPSWRRILATLSMILFCIIVVLVNIYLISNHQRANGGGLADDVNFIKAELLQKSKVPAGGAAKRSGSSSVTTTPYVVSQNKIQDLQDLKVEPLDEEPLEEDTKPKPLSVSTVDGLPEIEDLQISGPLVKEEANEVHNLNATDILPKKEAKATIAYAVSLTACASFQTDGAAILKHSVHLSSYPFRGSHYAYKMYVFAHPSAARCTEPFRALGYTVLLKETPINATEIRGEFYKEKVVKTGCCGEKEFLKLYAYTLVDHPVVVHLDLDSFIMQPLDDLFDAMLGEHDGTHTGPANYTNLKGSKLLPIMPGKPIPKKIEAFFTRDYNMVNPGKKDVGIQGGFIVVRPNLDYFEEYRQLILEGNFVQYSGWANKYGGYFGAQQIQGLCAYFYDGIHPGTAVELDRCIYNSMADNPYHKGTKNCRDGRDTCSDCRTTDVSLVKSAHFTVCAKPWVCPAGMLQIPNCKAFHREWFGVRKNLEEQMGVQGKNTGTHFEEVFLGYCKGGGERSYIPFEIDPT